MNVDQFGRIVRDLLRNDYDCVIAITSIYEGEGKSTLAKQLDMRIDPNFKLDKNVLFNPTVDQMKNLVLTMPKYSVIDADEAIKILYKLKWADKMQIFLNQLYALARSRNLATILCMPRYRDFGEFFRNHKIRFWIHIVERGTAIIMSKSWNAFSKDPWYLDENERLLEQYIIKRKIYNFNSQEKLKAFSKCKNVIGVLEFEDLPVPVQEEYKALRDKYKFDDIEFEGKTPERLKLEEVVQMVINNYQNYCYSQSLRSGRIKLQWETIQSELGLTTTEAKLVKNKAEKAILGKEKTFNNNNIINKLEKEQKGKIEPI